MLEFSGCLRAALATKGKAAGMMSASVWTSMHKPLEQGQLALEPILSDVSLDCVLCKFDAGGCICMMTEKNEGVKHGEKMCDDFLVSFFNLPLVSIFS